MCRRRHLVKSVRAKFHQNLKKNSGCIEESPRGWEVHPPSLEKG